MKIAIVVQGRFHAFDLTRELLQRGHEVTLWTNYPRWAAQRFGIPSQRVRSFLFHGVLSRLADWGCQRGLRWFYPEAALHRQFGRWAAFQLLRERWDVVHCWSGVSEELLVALEGSGAWQLLQRGSAHIRFQARILGEEEERTARQLDCPSPWIISREEREYALADQIVVPSTFAYQSFVEEGVSPSKLRLLPLGVGVGSFQPIPEVVESRCRRIMAGDPIRILYIGTISFRKGLWDLVKMIRQLPSTRFHFRLVGPRLKDVEGLLERLKGRIEIIPARPQSALPKEYAWGDLFVFPTIEDGYAMVLPQAQASALPILTTTNCSGPDSVQENVTGWVLPIRRPDLFTERLRWCDGHREELAAMVRRIYEEYRPRDWSDVAKDFEALCKEHLAGR